MLPNAQFPADLVTFTEEILNGKLYFLCSDRTNHGNGSDTIFVTGAIKINHKSLKT